MDETIRGPRVTCINAERKTAETHKESEQKTRSREPPGGKQWILSQRRERKPYEANTQRVEGGRNTEDVVMAVNGGRQINKDKSARQR